MQKVVDLLRARQTRFVQDVQTLLSVVLVLTLRNLGAVYLLQLQLIVCVRIKLSVENIDSIGQIWTVEIATYSPFKRVELHPTCVPI